MALPKNPIKLKEGLRIDFRTEKGKPLKYIRFEDANADNHPTYLGSLDASKRVERKKLEQLRNAISYLLREKPHAPNQETREKGDEE